MAHPRIELLDARNRYGPLWLHGPSPLHRSYGPWLAHHRDLSYEAPIVGLIQSGQYALFVDVGAAWGYHSIIAAHHCSRVVAIEWAPLRFGLLCHNTMQLPNVDRRLIYAGRPGTRARQAPAPWDPVESKDGEIRTAQAHALDDIILPSYPTVVCPLEHAVLVKIDVEGNELDVLAGAPQLLANAGVSWVVEVHKRAGVTPAMVDAAIGLALHTRRVLSEKHILYEPIWLESIDDD